MSNFIVNVGFQLSFEFLFAVENNILDRRLSRDYPLSPLSPPHDVATRSQATLTHLATILGRDDPEVTRNPDPRLLDTHVPEDRNSLDRFRWNALEAPQLIPSAGSLAPRENSAIPPAKSHTIGVELISPTFSFSEYQHALRAITRILARLTPFKYVDLPGRTSYNDRSPRHVAWTTPQCSFHVRFSPLRQGQYFDLQTLKNLIAIWASMEPEITKLQPLHHRTPLSGTLSLWNNMRPGTSGTLLRQEIYTSTSVPDLQDIFEFNRDEREFAKISFKTHLSPDSPDIMHCHAVEFREHMGTLDVRDVTFWIGFTGAMLGLAQELTEEEDVFDLDEEIDMMSIMEVLNGSYGAEQFAWQRLIRVAETAGARKARR